MGILQKGGPVAALMFFWGMLWWRILWAGEQLYIRDLTFFALPMKTYFRERVLAGEFPFWTPHVGAGMPFFADMSNQVLYPLNLLFLMPPDGLLSVPQALSWFCILHSLGGMLALYGLMRGLRVVPLFAVWAALLYGGSGYVLSITNNVNYLPATVWVPLGLWAWVMGMRTHSWRYGVCFAACLGLMLLAGDTLNPMLLVGTTGLFVLGKGFSGLRFRLGFFTFGVGLAALLAAVQLLPTLELVQHSVRQAPLAYGEATLWSFPPQRLIEWVQPFFFGQKYPEPQFMGMFLYPEFREPWAESIFIGLIPLLLACWGIGDRRRHGLFWLAVTVVALLLAFGAFGFYYPWLFKLLAPLQYQRYPEKLIFWTTLGFSILAGLGAQRLYRQLRLSGGWLQAVRTLPGLEKTALTAGGLLVSWLLLVELPATLWIWPHAHERSLDWGRHLVDHAGHVAQLRWHALGIVGVVLAWVWVPRVQQRAYLVMLLGVALLELGVYHGNYVPTAPTALLEKDPPPAVLSLMQLPAEDRVAGAASRLFYDDWTVLSDRTDNAALLDRLAQEMDLPELEESYPVHWIYRVLYNRERLLFNYGLIYGVSYLNGRFAPLQIQDGHKMDQVLLKYHPSLLMALTGVRYIITTVTPENPIWQSPIFREVTRDPMLNYRLLAFEGGLPKAYLAPNALYNDQSDVYKILTPAFENYRTMVELFAKPASGQKKAEVQQAQPYQITTIRRHPELYEFTVENPYPVAHLVLTESYFPGWQAQVNQQQVSVLRANQRFMAISVPQGTHRVKFRYDAQVFFVGSCVSLLGLFIGAWVLFPLKPTHRLQRKFPPLKFLQAKRYRDKGLK